MLTSFNPFPNDKSYTSKLKEFVHDNFELNENGRKFSRWEKEKLLVTSNFPFSSVFNRPVLQTRKNQGLFGKGLIVTF